MFTPAASTRSKLHQPHHQSTGDHLPPLPACILATTEDDDHHQYLIISNSGQQTYDHHDQQHYEHACNHNCTNYNSSGCESSSPSNYAAIFLPEQAGTTKSSGSGSLVRRSSSIHSLVIHPLDSSGDFNYDPAATVNNNVMGDQYDDVHRLVDLIDSCSVRRVFSTGDLQMEHRRPQQQQGVSSTSYNKLESSTSSSSIIEGMLNKACRYSPEEKRERIERYKTKRSHRNFNKKIKYACRKRLADSRPRIRGRFARNDNNNNNVEDEKWPPAVRYYEADDNNCEENNEEDDDDNWLDLFN